MNNAAKIYEYTRIKTSSNSRIIYMLHEKCVQLVLQAMESESSLQRKMLDHAQNIIAELQHALVIDDELSQGLFYIYDYCYSLLEKDDLLQYQQVIRLFGLLRDTLGQLLNLKTVID